MSEETIICSETDIRNNFNVHDNLKNMTLDQLRQYNMSKRLPYSVCAWNVDGNLNIGMMIRSACSLGAERFIVIGKKQYDKRSCVGSNHYLPIDIINAYNTTTKSYSIGEFNKVMAKYDYIPIFIETTGKHITTMPTLKRFSKKICLVFGSESDGLPEGLVNPAYTYSIPQLGVIRSYNVSAAAAIVMWELVRDWI